jgi:hypothetical protein
LLNAVSSADAVWGGTATVANLANLDSSAASWNNASSGSQTGSFTVKGFTTAASPVPAGSVLNSASLTVRYQNTAGVTGDSRSVLLTPLKADGTAGSPITVNLPSTSGSGIQTATVDLYGGGTGLLATAFHSDGYSGASAAYSVKVNHTGIETVDTVQLNLGYTPPAFRGETTTAVPGNCLASSYTGSTGGGCAVLTTSAGANYHGRFYVQGTTYVPKAVVDLTLNNITAQVLRFGVISRSLWVKETGSISYSGPVIEIPDNSTTYGPGGTVLYLNAYICEAAATCSASTGKLGLRARVLVFDPSGTPSPPSRQIIVQSWAMQR